MSENKDTFWSKLKYAISSVIIGFVTIIIGFFLGFCRRKDISDNRDRTENTRKQLTDLQGNCDKLEDTNRSTETILRTIRERADKEEVGDRSDNI